MTFHKFSFLAFLFLTTLFLACEDDEVVDPMDEEVITNLDVQLTPQSGGTAVTLTFSDIDGDGGMAPIITGGTLAANTTYDGTISLRNESLTPAEDITEEIMEEDDEHQFFFSTSGGLNLTVAYADQDGDNNPLGLEIVVQTGDASAGDFNVILRHEPDKGAAGVADGDITNAGGTSDADVTFPVTIQ